MSSEVAAGTVFGSYRIVKEIGKGGMGQVLLARHSHLERDAALKILSPQIAKDQTFVQRFMQEAKLAARLNHPNIVHIYDFGQVEERYYIAMEFVDGPSLGALLRHWGSFPEEQALMLMRQACVALSAAHGAGLIHRDIKPDNFMITKQWQLKLVDLGLARQVDEDLGLTATGFSAGTPHYISPEQVEGRRDLDPRVDIYSLGATLYHLLTGKPPFAGATGAKVMMAHLQADRPDPRSLKPELSPGITTVIRKMMAIDRESRYRDVYQLDRDFYLIQTGQFGPASAPRKAPPADTDRIVMPLAQPGTRVAPSAPSVSQIPPSEPWTASQLLALEDRLSRFVGPMAKLIVKKAATTATDIPELVQLIAEQIPDSAQRKSFLTGVSSSGQLKPPSQPSALGPTATSGTPVTASRTTGTSVTAIGFPPDLLDRIEKLLAGHVGPLARVIVKKAAAKAHSYEGLVNHLSSQIPDEKAQRAFREAVRKLSA